MGQGRDTEGPGAVEARLDRSVFQLGDRQFWAIVDHLAAPVEPNERLKRLLSTPAPWDVESQ
jgi:uncharacterized protein (DUF1778 family)